MKRTALKMNVGNMVVWTERSKSTVEHFIETAKNMTTDPERKERMSRHECVACYYSSRFGGSAVTTQPCMSCGKEELYGNTNTDALCLDCAKKHGLCKHCGGDIKLRVRRKKWPTNADGNA